MKVKSLPVYVPDTRGVTLSRYGLGNLKLGEHVYSYSRLPGQPYKEALGSKIGSVAGTCPGSTALCEKICYARRVVEEDGIVSNIWTMNTLKENVPPIPKECNLLRLHVSGDFDSVQYIYRWIERLIERPDVQCWAYTRSWRMASLLSALESLHNLPNMQLFASMDKEIKQIPPEGWRVAWLSQDQRVYLNSPLSIIARHMSTGRRVLVCPEETGRKPDCESCTYCFRNFKNDVVFLEH